MSLSNLQIATDLFKKLIILLNPFLIALIYHNLKPTSTSSERMKDAKLLFYVPSILGIIIVIFGQHILSFFDISVAYIRLAGGIMIALTAWKMLQNEPKSSLAHKKSIVTPMIVPICIGGSTLSLILMTTAGLPFKLSTVLFVCFSVVLVYFIIANSCFFSKKLVGFVKPAIIEIMSVVSFFLIFSIGINILVSALKEVW